MTLKLPKLAVSMQEGTIVAWAVKSGDPVTVGQTIYEIETEKSTFEIESPIAGTITTVGVVGECYPIGTPIAEIIS